MGGYPCAGSVGEVVRVARLRALLIPEGLSVVEVVEVEVSAAGISDMLGGQLLDDSTTGILPDGQRVTFYRGEYPQEVRGNLAAAVLAARVGITDRNVQSLLRGPVLVLGLDGIRDAPVPPGLLALARLAGLAVRDTEFPGATGGDTRP
jgi:hypothetical protein